MLGLFLFLLLLFATVFVAIRLPSVQTKVAQKAAAYLSETLNHQVTIGSVDIEFFSNVILEKVRVLDRHDEEMFYVGRAEADISAFSILHPNKLSIASLELQQPHANLVKYEGSDSLNLSTFISALNKLIVKDTTKTSQPFDFSIDELILQNGHFTYDDFNKPRAANGMDYFHLRLDSISGSFDAFVLEDTLKVNITDLSAIETRSNTHLHNLDTRMTYAPTFWEFDSLDLKLNKSNLQHYVRFDYNQFSNFTSFIDSVTMTINLRDSKLYAQDIATFAPQLKAYDENLLVSSGEFKGKVKDFSARNVDLKYGRHTHIVGNINADGLPNTEETFASLLLKPSTINASDIKQFLPQNVYEVAARLGTVQLEGRFLGFYDDFVANGSFATALGNVQSDINLKIDDNTRASSYKGYLKTSGFNLGKLLNTDQIRTVSLAGRVAGSGFTLQDANLTLDATINQAQLLDYNYKNIVAKGSLRNQTFTGKVSSSDPNLTFTADGSVSMASGKKAFNLVADLERVDLQALHLSKQPLVISAEADLNFEGLQLDAFEGAARFDSAYVMYNGKTLPIDSVVIHSEIDGGSRSLQLSSDLLALSVNGNFDYSILINDLQQLAQEYELNFESDEAATAAYYRRKPNTNTDEYALSYDIYLKHINPALQLFMPDLVISDFSKVEGSFRHSSTIILEAYATLDTILYNDFKLYGNKLELNTSKLQQKPDVLASALFTSARQVLPGAGETQDFYVEGIWNERTINFATSLRQPEQSNRATITGDLNFLENQVQVVFDKSNITLRENPWVFNPGNTLYISDNGRQLVFENFVLSNQNQTISAQGTISDAPDSKLLVQVENFDLSNLNPLITMNIAGRLNGELVAQDVYSQALLDASIQADSFRMDTIYIGNVNGSTNWSKASELATVDIGIVRNDKKVLSVTGNYNPQAQEDQLDLLAVMDNANLKLVEPILNPIMSDLDGGMEGRIRVLGRLDYPILKGSVMVNNGQFTFDYLNTTYKFSDRVYFGPNSISFRNAQLQDVFGNKATVSGGIAHDGFQNMVIDLQAQYRDFMVLNTTSEQNELFYGTAFATGTASVLGPVENLSINVDARSNENTRIVLPLDNQTEVARKDFIKFVNHNETDSTGTAVAVEQDKVDLSGINLNFNLGVTDDAYFEIIIDRTTGDVIRGSGNGDIRMTIDTRGDFNMFGTFEITNGAYNLNLLEGLVTREFDISPGGTITWNGDPLAGVMDITATYTQMASLSGLLPNDETGVLQGRYPITAIIDLNGQLLSPQIELGISFDQLPQNVQITLSSLISSIKNDESELNRQVFSLLVLQRLSPQGTFAAEGAGAVAVGGSLGSLLSSQLGNFLNTIDNNLEIDIGLGALDQNALSALQVRLSYTFLQGRLRVTSEAGIGNGTSADGTTTGSGYQGDWSVEYYLTKSGELRLRLEYNTIPQRLGASGATTRQSISVLHTKRFDSFREIFTRNKPRNEPREQIILDSDPRLEL
ncbi:translocation/assembly module TamB domain-containing protein [Pontibacter sp. 172403-2]|uniref:translocation/assembly module TamB domain-containing protein n=1 Tax=Pontibacter rufus TaxID=2791028 RepID=UPI0018AF8DB6|nr:translocation/assembly module TamB domain-containing protein [Pontibacter sp. 172403-2]